MRVALYGSADTEPVAAKQQALVLNPLVERCNEYLPALLLHLHELDFEVCEASGYLLSCGVELVPFR